MTNDELLKSYMDQLALDQQSLRDDLRESQQRIEDMRKDMQALQKDMQKDMQAMQKDMQAMQKDMQTMQARTDEKMEGIKRDLRANIWSALAVAVAFGGIIVSSLR